jgi:hypothetical protein
LSPLGSRDACTPAWDSHMYLCFHAWSSSMLRCTQIKRIVACAYKRHVSHCNAQACVINKVRSTRLSGYVAHLKPRTESSKAGRGPSSGSFGTIGKG